MGEMADYILEHDFWNEQEDEELDYHPNGRKKTMNEMPEYHPTIWTRANGEKIHIKDMNQHHLGNAIRHLEKVLEGYGEMPAIYFNMLKRLNEMGGGITADQIKALLDKATAKKPISMAIWSENLSSLTQSQYDLLVSLTDDGEEISMAVVDAEGDFEYPLLSISRRTAELTVYELPEDSPLGPWVGPAPTDK